MRTVRLVAFADLHLGRRKAPGVQWAREALADAAPDADVVVFTGDLLDKKKATGRDLADGIALFEFITGELDTPLVHVWGNHDVGSGMIPRFPTLDNVYRPVGGAVGKLTGPGSPVVVQAARAREAEARIAMPMRVFFIMVLLVMEVCVSRYISTGTHAVGFCHGTITTHRRIIPLAWAP